MFSFHQAILEWHCPVLADACKGFDNGDHLQDLLGDVDIDAFGLFVNYLNGQMFRLQGDQLLLNSAGRPAQHHRLIGVWVLAKRLQMLKLQNDAMNMLENRRKIDAHIQLKALAYAYSNTLKGDGLRRYIVDVCLATASSFSTDIFDGLPTELQQDIFEAALIKREEGGEEAFIVDVKKYHVVEDITFPRVEGKGKAQEVERASLREDLHSCIHHIVN